MGVLDEFGNLKSGQSFEISIDKFENGTPSQDFQLRFLTTPPAPPAPPAPELWMEMENQPFLGVMLKETVINDKGKTTSSGAMITEVIEGTAAAAADLEEGDIIVAIDGKDVANVSEVIELIQSKKTGDEIKVEVLRGKSKKKVKAILGNRPAEQMIPREGWLDIQELEGLEGLEGLENLEQLEQLENLEQLGELKDFDFFFNPDSLTIVFPDNMTIQCDSIRICQPFTWNDEGFELKETAFLGVTPGEETEEAGVIVGSVIEGSSAEKMGLTEGDVITSFNGITVNTFDELADQIGASEPNAEVSIEFLREGKSKTAKGNIGTRSVSAFKDFRIFHDYKGQDENGNYFYDYEFDIDNDDIELRLEELIRDLDIQREGLEQELDRIRERETMFIRIEIDDISAEEAASVNKNASPKLATENNLEMGTISLFPNPSSGLINLNFNLSSTGNLSVILYDANGNKVFIEERSNFSGNYNNQIDISGQSDGTYYLQITQGGKTFSKKIVKGE
jgi:molybdopterin-binding protein